MKLVFATHNEHKLKEVAAILPAGIELLSLNDSGIADEIPETGSTLHENARIKSEYVHATLKTDCFADDTGLEVRSLNNEPGVYSARYAGPEKNSEKNMKLLLEKLAPHANRGARFVTIISAHIAGRHYFFEGVLNGTILTEKRGDKGFGYDPVFLPEGYTITLAEMTLDEKNKISHRAQAFRKLNDFLEKIPREF